MECIYDIYKNGYDNGVCFGYIPEMTKNERRIWSIGYMDAKKGKYKTLDEIDLLQGVYNVQ
jgi:hypothetical protein